MSPLPIRVMDSGKMAHYLTPREFTNPADLAKGFAEIFQGSPANQIALEFSGYRLLYDILKVDSVSDYKSICDELSGEQKLCLANARFEYSDEVKSKHDICAFESFFILSTTLGAKECLSEMIENGADLFLKDPYSDTTWVHAIIEAVVHIPELEENMVDVYDHVMSKMAHADRRKLLVIEDQSGFRALELATKCGAFRIAKAIMETNGAYLEIAETRGLQTSVKYRLSDYEIGRDRNRYLRSPLLFLAYCKRRHQASLQASGILEMEVIKRIIHTKLKRALPVFILFCLARLAYLVTVLYFDSTKSTNVSGKTAVNGSTKVYHRSAEFSEDEYNGILVSIGVLSGFFLLVEILVTVSKMCQPTFRKIHWRNIFGIEDHLAQTNFYQAVQSALFLCCCFSYTAVGTGYDNFSVVMAFKTVMLPLCIFSAMYCIELLPSVGPFVCMLQRMVVTTCKFMFIDFLILSVFAIFFHDVTYSDVESRFVTYSQSHYSMFKLEQSEFGFGADPPSYIQFAHLVFYFLTVVLLFNFLIAVLSEAVTVFEEVKFEFMCLRRLGMALAIEDAVFWPLALAFTKVGIRLPKCLEPHADISVKRTALFRHKLI